MQADPNAAELLAASEGPGAESAVAHLAQWAPAMILRALQMMSGPQGSREAVRAYALRSLLTCNPEQVLV